MGRPSFSPPRKSKGCLHIHDKVRLILSLVGVGREWAGPVFLHPDNLASAQDWYFHYLGGGERMGGPSFSPPPKKQRLFAYSWQGMADTFTSRVGKEWAGPVFLHPDNLASAQDWYFH